MIRRFLLRVLKQAIEEFLAPQLDALRADLEAQINKLRTDLEGDINKLRQEMDARFSEVEEQLGRIEDELKIHSSQLARLDQRVIDLKETLDVPA